MCLKRAGYVDDFVLQLSTQQQQDYIEMFKIVAHHWKEIPREIRGDRESIVLYSYLIRRFAEIRGDYEVAPYFRFPSHPIRVRQYDEILNWIRRRSGHLLFQCRRGE